MASGLSLWRMRIGFGAGDFAQNLVYPAVSMYLLFFYTEALGIAPSAAAAVFLAAQLVDFVWNPLCGAIVDSMHPRAGKYRTWLIAAGLPLAALTALSFCNPFAGHSTALKLAFAAATHIAFSMAFTLVSVAYGALGASLTREENEITILTAVRIFMANMGCLVASAGVPLLVAVFANEGGARELPWCMAFFMGLGFLPSFVFMPLLPWLRRRLGKRGLFFAAAPVAILGMAALYALSRAGAIAGHPGLVYVAQFVKASGIIVATGYMWALVPEVIEYSERMTGRRLSAVANSIMGIFFRLGMALGKILPGLVLAWTGYRAAAPQGAQGAAGAGGVAELPSDPAAWFAVMGIFAVAAAASLIYSFSRTKERIVANAAESSCVGVAEIWREFRRNKPLRILALFFFLAFSMMAVGNASGAFFMNGLEAQAPLAQEGVRWLVCVIPATLMTAAAFAISRYKV